MTRKDYQRAADMVVEEIKCVGPDDGTAMEKVFLQFFRNQPNFDKDKFQAAVQKGIKK